MAYGSDRIAVTDQGRHLLRNLIQQFGPVVLQLPDTCEEPEPVWQPARVFVADPNDILWGRVAWHTELWIATGWSKTLHDRHITLDADPVAGEPDSPPARFVLRTRHLSTAEARTDEAGLSTARSVNKRRSPRLPPGRTSRP